MLPVQVKTCNWSAQLTSFLLVSATALTNSKRCWEADNTLTLPTAASKALTVALLTGLQDSMLNQNVTLQTQDLIKKLQ